MAYARESFSNEPKVDFANPSSAALCERLLFDAQETAFVRKSVYDQSKLKLPLPPGVVEGGNQTLQVVDMTKMNQGELNTQAKALKDWEAKYGTIADASFALLTRLKRGDLTVQIGENREWSIGIDPDKQSAVFKDGEYVRVQEKGAPLWTGEKKDPSAQEISVQSRVTKTTDGGVTLSTTYQAIQHGHNYSALLALPSWGGGAYFAKNFWTTKDVERPLVTEDHYGPTDLVPMCHRVSGRSDCDIQLVVPQDINRYLGS
jgi:hypothetical protein